MATPTTSGQVSAVALSGNTYIDALVDGTKWGGSTPGSGVTLSASFPSNSSYWASGYGYYSLSETTGFMPLTAAQQQVALNAMAAWGNVANIQWQQVSDTLSEVGDVRVAFSSAVGINAGSSTWGYAYLPGVNYPEGGDVWIDDDFTSSSFAVGKYDYFALLHELGHALGLKHPFEDPTILPAQYDSWQYSIMSYNSVPAWGAVRPSTPMLLDIQAIQYLYGANTGYHSGDDVYTFSPPSPVVQALWDAGGVNTLDFSSFSNAGTFDLNPGGTSSVAGSGGLTSVTVAYQVSVHKVITGSGDDSIVAGPALRDISGGAGTDTVYMVDGAYRFDQLSEVTTLRLSGVELVKSGQNYVTDMTPQDVSSGQVRALAKNISELYLASFGRAADVDGFDYWLQKYYSGQAGLPQIATGFVYSAEYQARFPSGTSYSSLVTAMYNNVLSRAPEQAGLDYWVNALNTGSTTPQGLMLDLLGGAQNGDRVLLDNRDAVSLYYTGELAENNRAYNQTSITSILQSVTADPATVTSAYAAIDAAMGWA